MNNNTGLTYKIYKDGEEVKYWEGYVRIARDGALEMIGQDWAENMYCDEIDLDVYTIELFYHGKKLNSSTEAAEK
jgi:hypothetical protein